MREFFPSVEKIVAAAPSIPNWQVLAFRQRRDSECEVLINGIQFGSQQLKFSLQGDNDRVGISLFFVDIYPTDEVKGAAYLLLDSALGEYDMETKVGFIEWLQIEHDADMNELKPFEQLPQAFDAFYEMIGGK